MTKTVIGNSAGTIKNLCVKSSVTGSYYVGGIVGKKRGTVSGCSFELSGDGVYDDNDIAPFKNVLNDNLA